MSTKKIMMLAGIAAILLMGGILLAKGISFFNAEKGLKNLYTKEQGYKKAFYANMVATIQEQTQLSVKNDKSFRQNIEVIMSSRQDKDGLMMKWIQESNPNANYQEVSKLYQTVMRVIEAKRSEFTSQEEKMLSIKLQHDNLTQLFPNNIYAAVFGIKPIEHTVISNTRTEKAFETGIDDTKLDLE